MNHAGEIEPLSRLARPHVAIITTIAPVHLEFFGSLAKIADAKAEIFLGLEPGGAARPQSRHRAIRSAQAPRQGSRCRAHRVVRRACKGRCAPAQMRAACRDCSTVRGRHPRHRAHLQDRRAGPASGGQFACGAGGRGAGRRRSRAGGAGARRTQAVVRPRRADRDRSARRRRRSSSTRATMPIRPRCAPRSRCSARRRSVRTAGASPCSATCWNSVRRGRALHRGLLEAGASPMRSISCSAAGR